MSPVTVLPSSADAPERLGEVECCGASDPVGGGGGGGGGPALETVNVEVITSVPPAVLVTSTVILCWPSGTVVLFQGFAVPVPLVPLKSHGAPPSVWVGVPVRVGLSSQNLTRVAPVLGVTKT